MAEDHFGERVAASYDAVVADWFAPELVGATVDLLADLCGDGAALELGIGTGRIALPLSDRGVPVHGIDLAPAMVEQLRAKPGAEAIEVTIGDFATTRLDATFRLVYLVFSTIMNLTSQDEQVECFCNAAAHLEPGGHFLVEVGVPDLQRLPPGETVRVFDATADHLGFDEFDVRSQRLVSHHHYVFDDRVEHHSVPFRYVWPSELDLMARIAGMRLRNRWSGWAREPFTSESMSHVSVWRKDG